MFDELKVAKYLNSNKNGLFEGTFFLGKEIQFTHINPTHTPTFHISRRTNLIST